MGRVIVIAFATLDGVTADPDGSEHTRGGGWAFRHGPGAVAGDKFKLGAALDAGALLIGRRTWELFAHLWPNRTDDFSQAMNRIPKLVWTRSPLDTSAWTNSSVVEGDLPSIVQRYPLLIVTGSTSIAHALAAEDLVDEYRILLFGSVIGAGTRLFTDAHTPAHLDLVSAEVSGPNVLLRYRRPD